MNRTKNKNKTKGTTVALLCLASGPLPNAANSSDKYFDVPSEFAGGDQLLVPYEVPVMSVLRIDWSRFFNCHASIVALPMVTPSVVT